MIKVIVDTGIIVSAAFRDRTPEEVMWNLSDRLWEMRQDQVEKPGLTERLSNKDIATNGNQRTATNRK